MSAITLSQEEERIREKLIQAASKGKTIYYGELIDKEDETSIYKLGEILERISLFEIQYSRPFLSAIAVLKSTGLPSEGFFESCDTHDISDYLSDIQKKCFEYWGKENKDLIIYE